MIDDNLPMVVSPDAAARFASVCPATVCQVGRHAARARSGQESAAMVVRT